MKFSRARQRLGLADHREWRGYNPLFRFVSRFFMGHTASIDRYLKDVAAHFNEPARLLN